MSDPKLIQCPLCKHEHPEPEAKPLETIEDYVREYARLDEESVRLEEAKKEANRKRETVEQQIVERYTMEGMTSTKISGLGSFILTTMNAPSIPDDKKDAAIAAFKKYYPDMVKETVHPQTLKGFINNALKEGTEIPPDLLENLKIFKKQYITWRK